MAFGLAPVGGGDVLGARARVERGAVAGVELGPGLFRSHADSLSLLCNEGYAARPGDDDLQALIEPLLPPWPETAPGPQPVDDRLCLQGILYVLCNDISWQLLPLELGFDPVRPAGADWAGGMRPVSSIGSGACSPNCTRPTSWTGPGPAWMPSASARKRGLSNRPVAGPPGEDGQ
ncbi:transposase [Streptomyces sp. NRRL F-5527]|uniref:transposase n=1 Tax=Streptomyces sp. NRRL F-5527 TaxID=1463862 RepID=UPI003B640527